MTDNKKRRGIKAWHIAGVILAVAVVGLTGYALWPALVGAEEPEENRPDTERTTSNAVVDVMVVEPTAFVLRAEATGHLAPWRRAEISSQATGIVTERPFEQGQFVSAGDMLLQLEDQEQLISVAEAETELLNAQIEYAARLAGSQAASADSTRLKKAEETYQKAQNAYQDGALTLEEYRQARRQYEVAVLRSGARREEVEAVVTGLSQAEQRLERARLLASRMRVEAPIAGRLADLKTEVGQRVTIGSPILTLLDDSRMKVEVSVLEGDLIGLRPGASARVRIPAIDDTTVTGRIHSINPVVDPSTGTGTVTVSIDNRDRTFISGVFAYVDLETDRLPDRIVVPTESVLVRQGRDLVFVIEGGRAQWTYVTTGRRSGDFVEIIEPLAPGDSVAVSGHHSLSHDARIAVGNVVEFAF